jgi:CDP-glycerol glycerophosphotransferase (TagB/SpsB family)
MKFKNNSFSEIKSIIQRSIRDNSILKSPYVLILCILQYVLPYFYSNLLYILIRGNKKKTKPIIGFSNLHFNGNPRAVFEYMLKHKQDYDIFWVSRNLRTIKNVQKAGGKAFLINGLSGIPYFLNTDLWVVAHKGNDIPFLPHKNYKVIQLWHAAGIKATDVRKKHFEKYDKWCISSDYVKNRYITLRGASPERLYVSGFARMDMLYNYLKMPKRELLKEYGIEEGKKIILYTPTFDVGIWPYNNGYTEFEKLCIFCKQNNLILILRLHPYAKVQKRKLKKIIKKHPNVFWLDMSAEPEVMKLLAIADILITAWSSTFSEFYLTKRPIIFMEVNKNYYTKERGIGDLDPSLRSGEIVHNNEEFFQSLKTVIKEGNKHKETQEKFLDIIHGNVDGYSSKRVADLIDMLVK